MSLLTNKKQVRKSRIERTPICILFAITNHKQMKGIIREIKDRGFGFITPENGGKDIFFHSSNCTGVQFNELKAGDAVTYDVEESEKGPNAVNVQRA